MRDNRFSCSTKAARLLNFLVVFLLNSDSVKPAFNDIQEKNMIFLIPGNKIMWSRKINA